jgi:hypothetical protein
MQNTKKINSKPLEALSLLQNTSTKKLLLFELLALE